MIRPNHALQFILGCADQWWENTMRGRLRAKLHSGAFCNFFLNNSKLSKPWLASRVMVTLVTQWEELEDRYSC